MKTKKEYIRPVMERLDADVAPVLVEVSFNQGGPGYGYEELSRQNDFTITDEDSDDDW